MRRSMLAGLVASVGAVAWIGLAGCNMNTSGGGTTTAAAGHSLGSVAIVDLDEIARRLGRDLEMNEAVQQQQLEINKQLKTLQETLKAQYDEEHDKLGQNATEKEQQDVALFGRQLDAQFAQERQKANNELSQYRVTLINRFREEVKPTAQQVAAERGLSIVVTKVDSLIYAYDPQAEITDAVVGKLAGSGADRSGGASAAPVGGTAEPPLVSNRPGEEDGTK